VILLPPGGSQRARQRQRSWPQSVGRRSYRCFPSALAASFFSRFIDAFAPAAFTSSSQVLGGFPSSSIFAKTAYASVLLP
jgi:hypothetical protein